MESKREHDSDWPTERERRAWPTLEHAATSAEAQVAAILRDCGDVVEPGNPGWAPDNIRYFVRRGFVVVPDALAAQARELLRALDMYEPPPTAPVERHTDVRRWQRRPGERLDGDLAYGMRWIKLRPGVFVHQAVRAIRDGILPDGSDAERRPAAFATEPVGVASGEYLIHIAGHTSPCPADEPKYVRAGTPPDPPVAADPEAGRGIRVLVVDTGLDPDTAKASSWLRGVRGDRDNGIGPGGAIARYAGHGTFIAGVVRTMAPAADVIVRAGLPAGRWPGTNHPPSGTAFEGDLAAALERYIADDAPDVINLSAGSLSSPDGLAVLEAFHREFLSRHKGLVIVAAAGNDGCRHRFWPAASPWTVSVGALSANWHNRALFSNLGAWVDVYAPGEYLTNAFPSGTYTYQEPPRIGGTQAFDGMAIWSGTSFAAPVVAGLIAARMSRTGENGTDAARALIARGRRDAIPGVGAVVLPRHRAR